MSRSSLTGRSRRRRRYPLLAAISALLLLASTLAWHTSGADAVNAGTPGNPQFKVVCSGIKTAPDDPIVFPNMPGKSHMHSFFGAKNVSASSTTASLLSAPASQCGGGYSMDRSAYWVPTLYKNGQPVFNTTGGVELRAYYDSSDGHPVDQPFPQGLRMIAGSMMATGAIWPATQTGYPVAWYKCVKTNDAGNQRTESNLAAFPNCGSDESMSIVLGFPDCWDGVHLDSSNHQSHMAYAAGPNAQGRTVCPSDHPIKLPRLTVEVVYGGVNGPGSSFSFATTKNAAGVPTGSSYAMHGDVMSAWDPTAFAGLTYGCINKGQDCSGLSYAAVNRSGTPASMIAVQTKALPNNGGISSTASPSGGMNMPMPAATATPSPKSTPKATPGATPKSTSTPSTNVLSMPDVIKLLLQWIAQIRAALQSLLF